MIVVLLWLALAWFIKPVGVLGRSWWSSVSTIGHELFRSEAGVIVGLLVGAVLLCLVALGLARGDGGRRIVGAGAVTLAVILLAGVGEGAWPIVLALIAVAGACTRDESMASVAELALLGLVLGGSGQVKSFIVAAMRGKNTSTVSVEHLFVLVLMLVLGAGVLYISAKRVGVFGERYLSAWVKRAWEGRKGGVKAKEASKKTKDR
jgi:hypothetical protein